MPCIAVFSSAGISGWQQTKAHRCICICALLLCGGKTVRIAPYGAKAADADYGDLRIVPGFMDVHCHGDYGFDTDDAGGEGLRLLADEYPQHVCVMG